MKTLLAIILTAFFMLSTLFNTFTAEAKGSYTLAMLPSNAPAKTEKLMQPIATHIAQSLGKPVEIVIANTFDDFIQNSNAGLYDITYSNPAVAIKLQAQQPIAVADSIHGGLQMRGIIIVPVDSPIKSLTDLEGKEILHVGLNSTSGYLSQATLLLNSGINLSSISYSIAPRNKHENVIAAVANYEVDAGFIRKSALTSAENFTPRNSIRILEDGAYFPNWIVSTSSKLSKFDRQAIAATFNDAPDSVLTALKLKSFRKTDHQLLEALRNLRVAIKALSEQTSTSDTSLE